MSLSNYHTHSRYCDGKDSLAELVQEAIRLGSPELGFSGHAHVPFEDCCMSREGTLAYIREVRDLAERYRGQIRILLGIEQDYFSDLPTDPYDYVIGSVHYLVKDGLWFPVDESCEGQRRAVAEHYGGDWYAFIEDYFACVGEIYERTGCTVVGHFDLVTKFNEDGSLFDTAHPRYRRAALAALDRLCESPALFEINTGAMARGYRKTPYPEPFLLQELERRGAGLILSSDCHDKHQLLYGLEALQGSVKGLRETLFP